MNPFVVLGVPHDVDDAALKLEKGEARRAALQRARELRPGDRRPPYEEAQELIALKRWDEALSLLDLMSRDLIDTEQQQEPLSWTLSSND